MFVKFDPIHVTQIDYRAEYEGQDIGPMAQALERGHAYSLVKDDRVVMVGGWAPIGDGRFLGAILFSRDAGKYMTEIVRFWRDFLETFDYNRLEAVSACDLIPAHKFLRLIGFECEAPRMRKFHGDKDYALFARTK